MQIKEIDLKGYELRIFKILDAYRIGLYLKSRVDRVIGDDATSIILGTKQLVGEDGILEIIDGVKNVEVKYDDFLVRWKEDQKLLKDFHNGGTKLQDFYAKGGVLVESAQGDPGFPDEQKNVPYRWGSGDYDAWTCGDLTMVDPGYGTKSGMDYFLDTRNEYYKTSEVLEVLEKWKEALEKWSNPEEKEKMIEEYEKGL